MFANTAIYTPIATAPAELHPNTKTNAYNATNAISPFISFFSPNINSSKFPFNTFLLMEHLLQLLSPS